MTRQTDVVKGREDMVRNNAGGFTFKVSDMDRLDRFLVLGTEGNTYYQNGAQLAKENAQHVISLLRKDPKGAIDRVVEVSKAGRAPKNEYALFVLALAAADTSENTRRMAFEALPQVARTGTHLFEFVSYAEQFRGWGAAMRKAIGRWYTEKTPDALAYQVVKYQSRGGWSNRDLLRLAHPKAVNDEFDAVFRWVAGGPEGLKASTHAGGNSKAAPKLTQRKDVTAALPGIIQAFEEAKTCGENRLVALIRDHNLPREAVPTEHLNSVAVWEALLEKMPMTAMVRNLATMTRNGLLDSVSAKQKVLDTLSNQAALTKSRIHPMQVLMALKTYEAGRGVRGSNTWTPHKDIVKALDGAFYLTFGNVTPTNKKTVLGLDVSGSMTYGDIAGFIGLNPRIASIAMALVTANVEPDYRLIAFTPGGFSPNTGGRSWGGGSSVKEIHLDPKGGLTKAIKSVNNMPFAGTDCSLPMLWADHVGYAAENFSVYTDNETYAGSVHPYQALKAFRAKHNVAAKLAVFGMTSTGFTIADPTDAGMMDFVGFDSAAPELAQQFFAK